MAGEKHMELNESSQPWGPKVVYDVPLGGYVPEITISMYGPLNVTGGSTSIAARGENPGGLVEHIEVIGVKKDGSYYPDGVYKKLVARSILRNRIFDKGKFIGDISGNPALADAVGTYNIYQEFELSFALDELKRPIDSALNTNELKSLRIVIYTQKPSTSGGIFEGSDRNFDCSALAFDFCVRREDMSGDTHVLYEEDVFIPVKAANARFQPLNLPAGMNYYDVLLIAQKQDGTLTDAIIQNVKVKHDMFKYDKKALDIKARNFKYGADASQSCVGLYRIPTSPDGLLYGAVPVTVPQDYAMELSVQSPTGNDAILARVRRVLFPENYKPASR